MINMEKDVSWEAEMKVSSSKGVLFFTLLTLVALALLMTIFSLPVLSEEIRRFTLTEEVVRNAFSPMINDDGINYNVSVNKIFEGPFTGPGAREALVIITDDQCHASGWTELWLMGLQGKWTPKLKLADTDEIDFEVMDINGNGVNEVYFSTWHMSTGAASMGYDLVSLNGGKERVLFEAVGFNYEALWFLQVGEETIHDHFIVFRDIDYDGAVEIVDAEVGVTFTPKVPGLDTYDYDSPRTTKRTDKITIYRFLIGDNGIIRGIEETPY